jgi:hypothetical protein
MPTKLQSGPLDALDPLSRARLRLFSLKLSILLPFSALLAVRYHWPLFEEIAICALWYGFFSGAVASFRRERLAGPSLNGWDELLAFFALKYLAQFLSVVIG